MEKITAFGKGNLKELREIINSHLKALSEETGLDFHVGNASYSDETASYKLECKISGVDVEKSEWNKHCRLYGFTSEDYGKIITINNERFKIAGLNLRSPKNCMKIKRISDDKMFGCNERMVKNALNPPSIESFL